MQLTVVKKARVSASIQHKNMVYWLRKIWVEVLQVVKYLSFAFASLGVQELRSARLVSCIIRSFLVTAYEFTAGTIFLTT